MAYELKHPAGEQLMARVRKLEADAQVMMNKNDSPGALALLSRAGMLRRIALGLPPLFPEKVGRKYRRPN